MAKEISEEVFQLMAAKFRMLCDASRLAILHALMSGERNVTQLVAATGRGKTNVSKHLHLLARAGLVSRRKAGLQVFYRLEDPIVKKLCHLVCTRIVKDFEMQAEARQPAASKKISKQRGRGF